MKIREVQTQLCRVPLRQRAITDAQLQHKLHVQLGAATPGVMMVENCYESIADIWEEPIVVTDGKYPLPQEPGVGLQIRSDVIAATRIG